MRQKRSGTSLHKYLLSCGFVGVYHCFNLLKELSCQFLPGNLMTIFVHPILCQRALQIKTLSSDVNMFIKYVMSDSIKHQQFFVLSLW